MFDELILNIMGLLLVIVLACMTIITVIGTAGFCYKIYNDINKPAISAEAE